MAGYLDLALILTSFAFLIWFYMRHFCVKVLFVLLLYPFALYWTAFGEFYRSGEGDLDPEKLHPDWKSANVIVFGLFLWSITPPILWFLITLIPRLCGCYRPLSHNEIIAQQRQEEILDMMYFTINNKRE
jgi:hypothetical protein